MRRWQHPTRVDRRRAKVRQQQRQAIAPQPGDGAGEWESESVLAKKDVTIIDQALPNPVQEAIKAAVINDKVCWYRQGRATYKEGEPRVFPVTPESIDLPQFTHAIYELTQPVSQLFSTMLPIVTAIPYTIKRLIRIKMNLGVHAKLDNENMHGMPHVDFTEISEPLVTAIYYVNDSTGDTIIFNERLGSKGPLTVKTRVAHKQGRLVVFDGSLLHAGNTPRTNASRVNVNINAFVYEGAKYL
jgi:hypothetical protein